MFGEGEGWSLLVPIREADLAPLAPTLSLTIRALRKRSGV